ncbi:hypothetical protein GCM10022393_03830 [Aquimarina addita]|uniref:Secretion system C-terminal sorting domain-containing protein n=1 Tax=Aquimarina addita TaxID=870485 RepID=A0ABP7X9D1_9FLAO
MKASLMYRIVFAILLVNFSPRINAQNNNDRAEEMLRLVNDIRTTEGLQPLVLNQELNEAAYLHSKDMGDQNYFNHTGLNGSSFSERVRDASYVGTPRGENIAAGNNTVAETFNQWVNSSGHLDNILDERSNEMGIGYAVVNGSEYTHYWTQIFGRGDTTLSVDNIADNHTSSFKAYPNPAQDVLYITLPKDVHTSKNLNLMSIKGKIVHQQTITFATNELAIKIDHLPKGVYLLNLQGTSVQKIVKR